LPIGHEMSYDFAPEASVKLPKTSSSPAPVAAPSAPTASLPGKPASGAQAAAEPGLPGPVQKGLISVPKSPAPPTARAVAARLLDAPFDSFMKVRRFEVDVARPGVEGVETVKVQILNGPGHNCSMVAPLVLDADGRPSLVLKEGDTRAARALRGEPYVKTGMIGGRWDKVGADPKKIGVEEIAEEIGAELVPNGFLSLGDKLVPTMPGESTEADRYFASVVRLTDSLGAGDHGGMEVVGLMKPVAMDVQDGLRAMDDGRVGEGARARVAYQRALDAIGFVPELDAYVFELPRALKEAFDTLGLGAPRDLRAATTAAPPPAGPPPGPKTDTGPAGAPATGPAVAPKAEQVNDVAFVSQSVLELDDGARMIDAKTQHLATEAGVAHPVGEPFPNQIFHVPYDRAKVVEHYRDPVRGPMVRLSPVERPVMAAKALALDGERQYKDENTRLVALDVAELKVELDGAKGAEAGAKVDAAVTARFGDAARRLGAACDASPGQSDLRWHFFAAEAAPGDRAGFVSLAEALASCRGGEGDAATEALLLRLATDQRWIPQLGMSVDRARKLAS
jgi:hypothetical protein